MEPLTHEYFAINYIINGKILHVNPIKIAIYTLWFFDYPTCLLFL